MFECFDESIIMLNEGMDKKEKKTNPKAHKRLIDKNVNEETVNYYVRIAATLDEGFEGDEDRGTKIVCYSQFRITKSL